MIYLIHCELCWFNHLNYAFSPQCTDMFHTVVTKTTIIFLYSHCRLVFLMEVYCILSEALPLIKFPIHYEAHKSPYKRPLTEWDSTRNCTACPMTLPRKN